MNYKYLVPVFIVVILLVSLIVYNRHQEQESFQNNGGENLENRGISEGIIVKKYNFKS